ncbi:MAG: NTP transferase domain-containing protein, partial [Polyangiaceae bacterium]
MRPIVIGAGRGSRLGPETTEIPKALVPVMGRPMLEWILEALGAAGFTRKDVIYICGYKAEVVRSRYPEFTFVENRDWEKNNILASLLCAREHL